MNQNLKNVLASTYGTAADMTHNLSLYGGGDMGAGVRNVWTNGICVGASVVAVLVVGYQAATYKRRVLACAKEIGTVTYDGTASGNQQEPRFRKYSAENGELLGDAEE